MIASAVDDSLELYRADIEITADSGDDKDSDPTSGDTGGTDWAQNSPATNHNDVTVDTDGTNDAFDDHDAEEFANVPVANISGVVREDIDGDSEPDRPLPGVTITLLDSDGGEVDSTTTGPDGEYLFTNVPVGEYTIVESDLPSYESTSDVVGPNDNEIPVTMVGDDIVERDFVDSRLYTISGVVEKDTTRDGVPDEIVAGATITLLDSDDEVVATTTTDSDGAYQFIDLKPGEYAVVGTDPAGLVSLEDIDGNDPNRIDVVSITTSNVEGQDFVDELVITEDGELVYIDPSGRVLECGNLALQGIEVTLFRSDSREGVFAAVADGDTSIMDPAINTNNPSFTDVSGMYRWDVVTGFYRVDVDIPGQGVLSSAILPVPPIQTDIDFDLSCDPTVLGAVTEDTNSDGTGDKPIPGVKIELLDSTGGVVSSGTTDVEGEYSFANVAPGNYTVREVDLAGFTSVSDVEGANDNLIDITVADVTITDRDFVDRAVQTVSTTTRTSGSAASQPFTGFPSQPPAQPEVPPVLALTGASSTRDLVQLAMLMIGAGMALSLGEHRRRRRSERE